MQQSVNGKKVPFRPDKEKDFISRALSNDLQKLSLGFGDAYGRASWIRVYSLTEKYWYKSTNENIFSL
jgi:hypothetical protein